MRIVVWVLVAVAVLLGAIPCAAKDNKLTIYGGYCYFSPLSSETREVTDKSWPQIAAGRFENKKPAEWKLTYDAASFRHNGDVETMLIPVTIGIQKRIGGPRHDGILPYVALRTGAYYGKIKDEDRDISESRIGLNANAAIGMVYREDFLLEARYDFFGGKLHGLRMDGVSLLVGFKLLQF
jgi:hypothetical protein